MAAKHQQRREVTKAMQAGYYESVPHSTAGIKERLTETISTITRLREDVAKVSDPRVRALFDTTREVLKDLVAAYESDVKPNSTPSVAAAKCFFMAPSSGYIQPITVWNVLNNGQKGSGKDRNVSKSRSSEQPKDESSSSSPVRQERPSSRYAHLFLPVSRRWESRP